MKIARFTIGGRPTVAVDDGRGFVDFGAILEKRGIRSEITGTDPERRLIRMMKRGMFEEAFLSEHIRWGISSGYNWKIDTQGLTPLIPFRPGKIICIARNWESHAKEGGHPLPDNPVFFAKTENCAIGPGIAIPIPENAGRVDHEGELGVVIGRRTRRVSASDALRYVVGYLVINDVTAREMQHELSRQSWPWFAAKSMDGFAPMGPFVVTRNEVEPLDGKRIKVSVNGEIRQDGSIDDMHTKVPQLIEAITEHITLYPGDVIATGTPSGVGPINPGDEVVVSIDGVGELVNMVKADD